MLKAFKQTEIQLVDRTKSYERKQMLAYEIYIIKAGMITFSLRPIIPFCNSIKFDTLFAL